MVRQLKNCIKNLLRKRGLYVYGGTALPRNVDLLCDLGRFSKPNEYRTVFDVGANTGQTSMMFLQMFPNASIFAFEPAGQTFRQLESNLSNHKRVTCEQLAVSDHSGTGVLLLGENSLVSRLAMESNAPRVGAAQEQTQVTSIGEYCRKAKIQTIDLLKTDTEGHDIAVLEGASALLQDGAIRFVYCEVGFSQSSEVNTSLCEVYEYMHRHRYAFFGLYDTRDGTFRPELKWADALFIHESQLLVD